MPRGTYAETGSYEIWSQVSLLSTKKYHKMFNETLDLQGDDNFYETEFHGHMHLDNSGLYSV